MTGDPLLRAVAAAAMPATLAAAARDTSTAPAAWAQVAAWEAWGAWETRVVAATEAAAATAREAAATARAKQRDKFASMVESAFNGVE